MQDQYQAFDFPGDFPGSFNFRLLLGLRKRVGRQTDDIGDAVIIGLESRGQRAIGSHRLEYFWYAGGTALGQVQFLEIFANPTVAVATAHRASRFQVGQPDRTVGTGKAQDRQFVAG
ncbi:hypothetical protein ASF04_22145 [Duganella sp. Leaf61]|nr:hypothetical protein ASF04_22145 [Duganella sp. Leaf61]